jgi:Uma2 family endonuclease
MATEQSPPLLSYDDYAALEDERPAQVVDGVLFMTPSPTPDHQALVGRLWRELVAYADQHGGRAFFAPLDVVLRAERPAQVVQPDAMYFSPARVDRVGPKHAVGAPDIAIEVVSHAHARFDGTRKRALYEEHGVREYWMVPPHTERIEVLVRGADGRFGRPQLFEPGDTLTSEVLPGFALDVAAVFRGLTPPEG